MKQRLDWLDFQKGIAIFLVVLGHVYQTCLQDTGAMFKLIYTFHMPFFFMLSGILGYKAIERGFFSNMRKKAISLLLPFVTCGLAFSLAFDKVEELLLGDFHAGYWFLLSLFTCWMFFIPLLKMEKRIPSFKGKMVVDMLILLAPFFLAKLIVPYIPQQVVSALSLGFTFAFYRFFVVGYFIGLIYSIYNLGGAFVVTNDVMKSAFAVLFCIVAIAYVKSVSWLPLLTDTGLQLLLCLGFFALLLLYKEYSNVRVASAIEYVGKNSLIVYCFHYFMFNLIDLSCLNVESEGVKLIVAIVMSVLIIVVVLTLLVPLKNKYLSKLFLGK